MKFGINLERCIHIFFNFFLKIHSETTVAFKTEIMHNNNVSLSAFINNEQNALIVYLKGK